MKKDRVIKLESTAKKIAELFSNPKREFNYNNETFEVAKIKPLTELTAAIIFKKSSGKLALTIAFWKNNQGGHWDYFFPTDSHILGFQKIAPILEEIENYNFDKNG